jgi:hypothetical protein
MNSTFAATSLLCLAGAAHAQTLIDFKVSTDGVTFGDHAAVTEGQTVVVRTQVTYQGPGTAFGLASFVFQPTVSNWNNCTLLPFINGGVGDNTSGGVVPADQIGGLDGPWGRVSPWGRAATTSTGFLRGHYHTGGAGGAPAGSWLRIAQNHVTSWIGGAGNTTGGSGVPISQLGETQRGPDDPPFNSQADNIIVLEFAIRIEAGFGGSMQIDAPIDGFGNRNAVTGVREVYWWDDTIKTGTARYAPVVDGATITLVPSPGAIPLMTVLLAPRRRRAAVSATLR